MDREKVGRDAEEFSVFMVPILETCLDTSGRSPGRFGGYSLPLGGTGAQLGLAPKTLKRYLRAAARAGIIKCISWYDVRRKERFPIEVIVAKPILEYCGKTTFGNARDVGKALGALWLSRLDHLGDVQGFGEDDLIPWGRFAAESIEIAASDEPEPKREPSPPSTGLMARIADAAAGKKTVSAAKREEREKRLKARDAWVVGAAVVWRELRARRGYGTEAPGWVGQKSALPPAQKKERNELERIFERYGGRKSAFAWALFCGGKPKRDDKGKLVFDPDLAHRQWTTSDKKPSHFAKHIDLILADLASSRWEDDSALGDRLMNVFGETFAAAPIAAPDIPAYEPKKEATNGN